MNQKTKLAVLAGVTLAANAGATNGPATAYDAQPGSSGRSDVLQIKTHEFESSFLKVSAACKVSHAAFEAVSVGLEQVPAAVLGIHAEIETA